MLAFALLAGLLLKHIPRAIVLLAAVGLAVLSFGRAQIWSTERTIWAEAVERAPGKLRPRILLARASDTDAALQILDAAEHIAPRDPRPALEKGLRLMQADLPSLALPQFEHALALAPDDVTSLNNHGAALAKLGQRDAAVEDFRHALRIDPYWASARTNLERLGIADTTSCK
jgi:protein O-mannosyl-transferase